jgi:hypothetical protein
MEVLSNLVMLAAFKAVVRPTRSQVGSIPMRLLQAVPRSTRRSHG